MHEAVERGRPVVGHHDVGRAAGAQEVPDAVLEYLMGDGFDGLQPALPAGLPEPIEAHGRADLGRQFRLRVQLDLSVDGEAQLPPVEASGFVLVGAANRDPAE
ncbi:hypothetical protein ACH4EC_21985 [Streptomyces anulatus]